MLMGRRAGSDSEVGFKKCSSSRSTGMGIWFGTERVWLEPNLQVDVSGYMILLQV